MSGEIRCRGEHSAGEIRCQFGNLRVIQEIRCQFIIREIRCQFIILEEIRCQFIILARK